MKFNEMCSIILTEAKEKATKFEKLVVGNKAPVFTREDIMRDPTDPTKGSMLYLADKERKVKEKEGQTLDPEVAIRRQLRRVNWVAKTIIKTYGNRQAAFSIEEVNKTVQELLERYQTNVLGWEAPDKANTGYEARVIGNLLLPPTKRNPSGKSVLMLPGMDPNATVEDASTPVQIKKVDRKTGQVVKVAKMSAEDLFKKYDEVSKYAEEVEDTDMKEVVQSLIQKGGATANSILKDEKVFNVYNPEAVKYLIRSMERNGKITKNEDGTYNLVGAVKEPSPYAQEVAQKLNAMRAKQAEAETGEKIEKTAAEIEGEEPSTALPKDERMQDVVPTHQKPTISGEEEVEEPTEPWEDEPAWWGKARGKEDTESEEPKKVKKSDDPEEEEEEQIALKRYGIKK